MPRQLLQFRGLFGDQSEPFRGALIHHEPLQMRSDLYNFEIQEHLHTDLVQVFLITEGGGLLYAAGVRIPLESPCVFVIPRNRLHGFVFKSQVRGEVFTIAERFFDQLLSELPDTITSFDRLNYFPLDVDEGTLRETMWLKEKIIAEMTLSDRVSQLSLKLIFQLLMIKLDRSKQVDQRAMIASDNRAINHFLAFKKLIKSYSHEGKLVTFYAKKLNLTSVHLNRICQEVVQMSALQIIHEQVLIEAKNYLRGTSNSIAEIAYFLGFKDPAHFSKFFKKIEGIPPVEFRKRNELGAL